MPSSYNDSDAKRQSRKQLIDKAKAKIKLKFPHLEIGSRQYENVLSSYMR